MTTTAEQQGTLELDQSMKAAGPVECLGLTFDNDEARREHFLALLEEKLQDPEFRKTPGFPQGSDESILRMSDPPYYTACPNPFLEEFVRCYGKPYDPDEVYEREPFAVDVSVGKTDQLYKAHGYHTKVPHLAIVPSILHYTKPGDIVLDGFCGSGMTGLAAQWCGTAPLAYRQELEALWQAEGHEPPEWGVRKVILNDLSPAASHIAAGYCIPFNTKTFSSEAKRILADSIDQIGWMYEVHDSKIGKNGRLNFMVWSNIFACPECSGEINFTRETLEVNTKKTRAFFDCPHCGAQLTKAALENVFESKFDESSGAVISVSRRQPVLVNYTIDGRVYEREVNDIDLELINKIKSLPLPAGCPQDAFPFDDMWEASRLRDKGITGVHHLFLPRAIQGLTAVWQKAAEIEDAETRRMVLWLLEQAIWSMSILNRYRPTGYSQVGQYLSGVYYVPSQTAEVSPWCILYDQNKRTTKIDRLAQCFTPSPTRKSSAVVQTGDCALIPAGECSVDYVFTDPPFGDNFAYWELNFLVESWHSVLSRGHNEAAVDRSKANRLAQKSLEDYKSLMQACFKEYYRLLKPGRWMTVVFSNSKNAVWRALQEAIGAAGFVVADVRTLDKQQLSFKQVTSAAVKQDLVISAYKPTDELQKRFEIGQSSADGAWAFVREHLHNVPVFVGRSNEVEIVVERTPQMLLDRMIAFHVQHGLSVPLSGPEFLQGLAQRFPERDGMYFLPDQVTEYDRKRTTATQLRQLSFFVNDEHSAIQWIRQQLQDKPQSFQDLQPQFMRELQAWAKHEQTVELKVILEQNFLHYDGRGPVPSQIHSYLSSNFKDLRNLDKEDPKLIEKAQDRWYVPDPNKQADLDQIRERALLKEFEELKESTQRRIKQFRTEAVRAGFKACWQERDYATIVKVAAKLPEAVLQEDEKLLMYIDNAQTRLGDDG